MTVLAIYADHRVIFRAPVLNPDWRRIAEASDRCVALMAQRFRRVAVVAEDDDGIVHHIIVARRGI